MRPDASLHDAVAWALKESRASSSDLEPWTGYFDLRAWEMSELLRRLDRTSVKQLPAVRVLDVGPGIGFSTTIWSTLAEEVYALDLPHASVGTHTLDRTLPSKYLGRMREHLGAARIYQIGATARRLPFVDSSFPVVFSSFAYQYVPDRPGAFAELARVLCDGGVALLLVPTALERIASWMDFYLVRLKARMRRNSPDWKPSGDPRIRPERAQLVSVRRFFPTRDFPYTSHAQQWWSQRASVWTNEIRSAGLEVLLAETFVPPFSGLTKRLGLSRHLRIIARKPAEP